MDEEELEEGCLVFRAGADASGTMGPRIGETGIGTDVCAHLRCGIEDVDPAGVEAAIPCVCFE